MSSSSVRRSTSRRDPLIQGMACLSLKSGLLEELRDALAGAECCNDLRLTVRTPVLQDVRQRRGHDGTFFGCGRLEAPAKTCENTIERRAVPLFERHVELDEIGEHCCVRLAGGTMPERHVMTKRRLGPRKVKVRPRGNTRQKCRIEAT